MPDHLHMVVEGMREDSDLKAFAALAKQYSGFYYAQTHRGGKLWQKGLTDHIARDRADLLESVRYVVNNPVNDALARSPEDYPFIRSQRWSREELFRWARDGGAPPSPGVHLDR